jgi:hypothetical protein
VREPGFTVQPPEVLFETEIETAEGVQVFESETDGEQVGGLL